MNAPMNMIKSYSNLVKQEKSDEPHLIMGDNIQHQKVFAASSERSQESTSLISVEGIPERPSKKRWEAPSLVELGFIKTETGDDLGFEVEAEGPYDES